MKRFILVSMAISLVFLFACNSNEKHISDSDFGEDWPFSVSSGSVECLGDPYVIIFNSNGRTYALNDAARATEKFEDISVIVKADDNYPGGQVKMDLSIIEFEGLKLCAQR